MSEQSSGFVLDTPEQIEAFRLLALRSMLKMQVSLPGGRWRTAPGPIVRGILKDEGLRAPRDLKGLLEVYEQYLIDLGVLIL